MCTSDQQFLMKTYVYMSLQPYSGLFDRFCGLYKAACGLSNIPRENIHLRRNVTCGLGNSTTTTQGKGLHSVRSSTHPEQQMQHHSSVTRVFQAQNYLKNNNKRTLLPRCSKVNGSLTITVTTTHDTWQAIFAYMYFVPSLWVTEILLQILL